MGEVSLQSIYASLIALFKLTSDTLSSFRVKRAYRDAERGVYVIAVEVTTEAGTTSHEFHCRITDGGIVKQYEVQDLNIPRV